MLKALRNRSLALLWSGQALSAIGDEIYRVALIWLAVDLIGADTGYLGAAQCAALLLLSLLGGKWADSWEHSKTMIWVDGVRAIIVLVPVVLFHFMPLSLPVLWAGALSLAGLGAFFDPAIQACLPFFSPDQKTLQAAAGLMSTTLRLARVVSPGIIGLLTPLIPAIHFFTLNAVTFVASAISIAFLAPEFKRIRKLRKPQTQVRFKEGLISGVRLMWRDEDMRYMMFAKGVLGGAWSLAYTLGLALLVHEISPHDMRSFGWVMGAYGIGNLGACLILGNFPRRRPAWLMFSGFLWMGFGFLLLSVAPSLQFLMWASALTAVGGPLNDLPFVDMVQARYPVEELAKVFRLRMVVETGATLLCMLVSPMLFRMFSVPMVIGFCGIATLICGVIGLVKYSEEILVISDAESPTEGILG